MIDKKMTSCFNPCSPEGFSQTYFQPPRIINTGGHITLTQCIGMEIFFSIDTKISNNH